MEDSDPLDISQVTRIRRGGWTNRRGFRDQLRAFGLQDRRAENRFRDQSIPQELTGYWRCPEQGGFVRECSDVTNPLFTPRFFATPLRFRAYWQKWLQAFRLPSQLTGIFPCQHRHTFIRPSWIDAALVAIKKTTWLGTGHVYDAAIIDKEV